jgi:hypothetical protein
MKGLKRSNSAPKRLTAMALLFAVAVIAAAGLTTSGTAQAVLGRKVAHYDLNREQDRKEFEDSLATWEAYYQRRVALGLMSPKVAAAAAAAVAALWQNPEAADVARAAYDSGSWFPGEGAP